MQYPIIDLIADAYINNGWTGLDISTGKNLWNNGDVSRTGTTGIFNLNNILTPGTYTVSYNKTTEPSTDYGIIFLFGQSGGAFQQIRIYDGERASQTFTITQDVYRMNLYPAPTFAGSDGVYFNMTNIQIEIGTEATPYEPYDPNPKNDFPNRLKLPLPHYFPHPVIDALQRAAAGTQTSDDTEILRHYLTPLGIGGI